MSDTPPTYGSINNWDIATQVPRSGGRRPPRWLPNGGLVIPAAATILGNGHQGWVQVAPQRLGRHDIVIVNIGLQQAFLSSQQAATNPVTIGVAATWSLDTESEVWAWSLNGTSLDISETVFPIQSGAGNSLTPGGPMPSIEPLVNW